MDKLLIIVVLLAAIVALGGSTSCYQGDGDKNSADQGEKTANKANPCDRVRCGWGSKCRLVEGRSVCECPSFCITIYDPVCGSDGKTYGNSCNLNVYNCNNKKSVVVAYMGTCKDEIVQDNKAE